MTLLSKKVVRELPITFDRRRWIVEAHPWGLEFRAKREKKRFSITWDTALSYAIHIHVEHARNERHRLRRSA